MIKLLGEIIYQGRSATKALSYHVLFTSSFLEAMRTCIWIKIKAGMVLSYSSQLLKLNSTIRNRTLEEHNFHPLPSACGGYIDENSYVLGSYEFFLAFSQDVMPLRDF